MNVFDAIMNRRTIRKFKQDKIEHKDLLKLIDCARVAAYGANIQPLKFALLEKQELLDAVFPSIKWAGYLDNGAPRENERPTAYIAVLGDVSIKPNGMFETDAGAAVTNMMLEAQEIGLGSCWLGAIEREKIKKLLGLRENLQVVYLLALGYPAQESKMVSMRDDVRYYLDDSGVLQVPKRSMEEILIEV